MSLSRRGLSVGPAVKLAVSLGTVALLMLAAMMPGTTAAASSVVDCGQVSGYTAPDPAGPTDGSLTLGTLSPWVIAADATVSPAVTTSLPGIVNAGPSCFAFDLDDGGVITAIDFAAQGVVSGSVTFDGGFGGYIFASRLLVPTFITDAYPGLRAVFATSAAAGTTVTATFSVDVSNGQFSGLDARAAFCGRADLAANGDGRVGNATIPASVLDATDSRRLASSGSRRACAAVRTQGTINNNTGELSITTSVSITVAPAGVTITLPPTATAHLPAPSSTISPDWPVIGIVLAFVGALSVVVRPSRGRARSRS